VRQHQPLALERVHDVAEAPARLADQIGGRDAHVVEEELGGVARVEIELAQASADREAAGVGRHHQQADPTGPGPAGPRRDRHEVRAGAIGDEDLAAAHDEVAAVPPGDGLERGHVGASARLGHAERGDPLPAQRRREPLPAQRVRAVIVDHRRRHLALHQQPDGAAEVAPAHQLLDQDHAVPVVEAAPAPARVVAHAEQAERAGLAEDLVGEALGGPRVVVRPDLLAGEAPDRGAEGLVLVAPVGKRHRASTCHAVRATSMTRIISPASGVPCDLARRTNRRVR
jgi:hypothetical protein